MKKDTYYSRQDYFKAISEGDTNLVAECLKNRLINWAALDEAALDLATRLGHTTMVPMIQENLDEDTLIQEKFFERQCQSMITFDRILYDRVELNFDRRYYYFSKLLLDTFQNKSATLHIVYRTQFERPYLKEVLVPVGCADGPNYLYFTFDLKEQSETQLLHVLQSILKALIQLKKKDGSEIPMATFDGIVAGLKGFFVDATLGFPAENFLMRHKHDRKKETPPQTYLEYQLYDAAVYFKSKEMVELLSSNPDHANARFDKSTILHLTASLGCGEALLTKDASERKKNCEEVLKTIKYLLLFGADPGLEDHGETLMEFLVRYSQFVKEEEHKELYRKIISLLPADESMQAHVSIHPNVERSPLVQTVEEANAQMKKTAQCKPYIQEVVTSSTLPSLCLLKMADGAHVRIESKKGEHFAEKEYQELYRFFEVGWRINPQSTLTTQDYFKQLMSARSKTGTVFVDKIFHNEMLKGMNIYEIVLDPDHTPNKNIYHVKLTLLNLKSYPRLIIPLTWLRGFAHRSQHDQHFHYMYCEAISSCGFTLCDNLPRFPVKRDLAKIMPDLIKRVSSNEKDKAPQLIKGRYYLDDPLEIKESNAQMESDKPNAAPTKSKSNKPTFQRELYDDLYREPGKALCIAFLNNADNLQLLKKSLLRWVGNQQYNDLLAFFSKQLELFHMKEVLKNNDFPKRIEHSELSERSLKDDLLSSRSIQI